MTTREDAAAKAKEAWSDAVASNPLRMWTYLDGYLAGYEACEAAMRGEIARLRHINKKFKVHGTDGCKSCEAGRVTLFIANDECISCNPESYELVTPEEALKETQ